MKNRQDFLNGFYAEELLKKFQLTSVGNWEIFGEDPNCDLGGGHYMPKLAIVYGVLSDVIDYAIELPKFWTWGGGGEIKQLGPIIPITSQSTSQRKEKLAKVKKLEEEINRIKKTL